MTPAPIDFAEVRALAAGNLPAWLPRLLGKRLCFFPPGSLLWWPNASDGVHLFPGDARAIFIADWSLRWVWGDRWGTCPVALVAELRRCRQGQAAAAICNAIGAPVPRLPRRAIARAAA